MLRAIRTLPPWIRKASFRPSRQARRKSRSLMAISSTTFRFAYRETDNPELDATCQQLPIPRERWRAPPANPQPRSSVNEGHPPIPNPALPHLRVAPVRECLTHHRNQPAFLQPADGQAIPAAHSGLFEDVLQMDLDGSRTNAQFERDLFVLEALLHHFEDLVLPGGELGARVALLPRRIAEHAILHPAPPGGHGAKAAEDALQIRGLAHNALGAGLQQTQRFGFGHRDAPYRHRGSGVRQFQIMDPIQHDSHAESLV